MMVAPMTIAQHSEKMNKGLDAMAGVLDNWCSKMDSSMGLVKETTVLEVKMTNVEQQLCEIKKMITDLPQIIASQYVSKGEHRSLEDKVDKNDKDIESFKGKLITFGISSIGIVAIFIVAIYEIVR